MVWNMERGRLNPIERKWVERTAEGIARFLARGGIGETPEEYRREVEEIKRIALEPGSYIYKVGKEWRRGLIERFLGIPLEELKKMSGEEVKKKLLEKVS